MEATAPVDASAVAWACRLAQETGRAQALDAFAREAGAEGGLLLARDDDTGVMLPVRGVRQTLPRGEGWRGLLQALRDAGTRRCEVEDLAGGGTQPVLAHSNGAVALVLVGGQPDPGALAPLEPLWELVAAAVAGEQRARALAGELRTARSEMRQFAAQAQTLDETRLKLDGTVRQLGEQARRAEEAGRAKDEFLAMLGHELRNPLSPIVMTLEVLRMRGDWRPELDVVKRQVHHMQRLVEDLLDVSRIARGQLTLDSALLDLGDVLVLAREAGPQWSRKQQRLRWKVPGSGLPVLGDRARLVQVFTNLLDNAAKYSGEGAEIRVEAEALQDAVRVSIHDQGIGLEPEQLERVFNMFEQGHRTPSGGTGLGLGLAIVRNLLRQHGGRVWAESEGPGKGSVFRVELPLAPRIDDDEKSQAESRPKLADAPARVLVVDDNADALTTTALLLRMSGCAVLSVLSGEEALAQAPAFAPDVAVLDIGMPGMDGLTLARRLREDLGPEAPPLVALTGFGQPSDRERAEAAGFDAFLVKPVNPAHLHETIRSLTESEGGDGDAAGSG
ncbi:hybrid sensor histidine kinase/response regulator [Luteimonas vadosa]|uniref:histidine kinase n=1 Tax=Luteimonas vadosa TaxID=1165507 RepID=A0ABP9DYQ5_9GAMM